jgi:hypothetical protein
MLWWAKPRILFQDKLVSGCLNLNEDSPEEIVVGVVTILVCDIARQESRLHERRLDNEPITNRYL